MTRGADDGEVGVDDGGTKAAAAKGVVWGAARSADVGGDGAWEATVCVSAAGSGASGCAGVSWSVASVVCCAGAPSDEVGGTSRVDRGMADDGAGAGDVAVGGVAPDTKAASAFVTSARAAAGGAAAGAATGVDVAGGAAGALASFSPPAADSGDGGLAAIDGASATGGVAVPPRAASGVVGVGVGGCAEVEAPGLDAWAMVDTAVGEGGVESETGGGVAAGTSAAPAAGA